MRPARPERQASECIAVRRAERWAAVVPGEVDVDVVDLPSPEEARAAVLERDADSDWRLAELPDPPSPG